MRRIAVGVFLAALLCGCTAAGPAAVSGGRSGVRFAWVGMDGGYGKEPALLRALDTDGEVFMAHVHKDQQVDLEDPRPQIPAPTGRGRPSARAVAQTPGQRVDAWASPKPETA